jgi:phage recombination protein Bet
MNSMVKAASQSGALVSAEQAAAIREALKNSLYPGATDGSVDMVLSYCRAAGLDPMTKPVHLVPMSVKKAGTKDQYEWRDVVMPGIELYRTKAHRTGEYAGQDDAEFGPTVEMAFGRGDGQVKVRFPEWCRVTVYRIVNDQRVPYSARVYWLETYATAGRNTDAPNSMWQKRPFGQLEKCAEALALRKAFPEAVGAQPTAEEMEGRILDVDAVAARPAIEMPRAKDTAAAPAPDAPKHESGDIGWQITDSQKRLLLVKAKNAGVTEESLRERYPSISADNINDVLAELTSMVSAGNEVP